MLTCIFLRKKNLCSKALKNRTILRQISRRGDETQSENSERSNFSEFCERTSLHGWQHIHRVNTRKGRIVWLSIVLASLSVALLFLTTATKDFANRAVVTTIETTTASLQVSLKNCRHNELKPFSKDNSDLNLLFLKHSY